LDSQFKSYGVLKILSKVLDMLSAIANAAKFAQNCKKSAQICPKIINLRNFEIPPKIEILVFL
jgi:hypothetical protein